MYEDWSGSCGCDCQSTPRPQRRPPPRPRRPGGGFGGLTILGVIVMFIGFVIVLISLPGWLWLTLLGLVLIFAGLFGGRCFCR